MLGVVAGATFLSGSSRMWASVGDKSDLAFYSSLLYELFFAGANLQDPVVGGC